MRIRTQNCLHCGTPFSFPAKQPIRKYCGHRCAALAHNFAATGNTPAARTKAADTRRGSGKGDGYIKRGGRHEHRVVAEQKLGRPLAPGEVVHHDDETKNNNAPDNLIVLASQADHARLHFKGKKKPPKTLCKRGHPLSGDNVYITSQGHRTCLICSRTYHRNWQKARRAERRASCGS